MTVLFKQAITGAAATFAGLMMTAATVNHSAMTPDVPEDKGRPCGCRTEQKTLSYDISKVTRSGVCFKAGDHLRIVNEEHTTANYGNFIHTFNGAFGPMDGCDTPTCQKYNEFPDERHGLLMAVLIRQNKVVQAYAVNKIIGKDITIPQAGELVFYVNDNNIKNNAGGGRLLMNTDCGQQKSPAQTPVRRGLPNQI